MKWGKEGYLKLERKLELQIWMMWFLTLGEQRQPVGVGGVSTCVICVFVHSSFQLCAVFFIHLVFIKDKTMLNPSCPFSFLLSDLLL